ncbi:RNA-directed DNA polymerase from mobile element jockey-like, partial [Brachionus plicatilis]
VKIFSSSNKTESGIEFLLKFIYIKRTSIIKIKTNNKVFFSKGLNMEVQEEVMEIHNNIHTPVTTPTKLLKIREDISVLRKKRNEREEDDVENRAQKVLISDRPDSVDKVRRRVEDLELELGLYDAILNDLIELAESLEKDSKVLSDSTKKEFERVDKEINEKFEELNNRMSRIDSDSGNVVGAESIGKSWADAVTNPGALTFSKQQREMSILLTMEREDEERRSKNIVIFGLARSEKEDSKERQLEDQMKVEQIFDVLKIDRRLIVRVNRMKQKSDEDKNTPMIVTLPRESDKKAVLAEARRLKNSSKYTNVYINPDLNFKQRMIQKELRKQRKEKNEEAQAKNEPFRYGIRGSFLRPIRTVKQSERRGKDGDESTRKYYGQQNNYSRHEREHRWQDKHPAYESSRYDNGNRYEQYRDRYEQNRNRYEQYTFPSRPHDGYSRY